jgi:hypothetical protein
MPPLDNVGSEEIVLRHIPGGTTFQAPGPRITSKNFVLRPDRGETGVSVSRAGITSAADLLTRIGDPASGSRIASAAVAAIRRLGLDVVPAPIDADPGHAEIRSDTSSLEDQEVRRRLAKLFAFVASD